MYAARLAVSAVKSFQDIAIVVHLEPWREGEVYDRLGLKREL